MADLKVRAEAWGLARLVTDMGGDLTQMEPGPDGWHTSSSIQAALAKRVKEQREAPQRKPEPAPAATMTPDEAYASGRITDTDLQYWRARYEADTAGTGRTLARLAPSPWHAAKHAGRGGTVTGAYYPTSVPDYVPPAGDPATPRLNALDEAMFGPTPEVQRRREDLAAERALVERETQEAVDAAHRALTEDEMRSLFPPER